MIRPPRPFGAVPRLCSGRNRDEMQCRSPLDVFLPFPMAEVVQFPLCRRMIYATCAVDFA
jgi:hypothetical protein